jgi:hypothetical protein
MIQITTIDINIYCYYTKKVLQFAIIIGEEHGIMHEIYL